MFNVSIDQKTTRSFHDSALFRSCGGRDMQSYPGDGGRPPLRNPGSAFYKKAQLPKMEKHPTLGKASSMPSLDPNGDGRSNHHANARNGSIVATPDDATSGYRLYAIENMADSSLHASRSQNHTWQTLRTSGGCNIPSIVAIHHPCLFDSNAPPSQWTNDDKSSRPTLRMPMQTKRCAGPSRVQANVVALYRPVNDMDKRVLTSIVFEQKWSDIVLGELEGMLLVSFFEQGSLLRNVRIQYATAFYRLEMHYTACEMEHERAEADRKLFDAKEQIAKMSETMKTLNAIFKQMREDSDKVRAIELKETNQKLERKCNALDDEAKLLRPLVAQNRTLEANVAIQSAQLDAATARVLELEASIQDKEGIIENLLHRQEQLLVKQDMLTEQRAKVSSGGDASGGDQGLGMDAEDDQGPGSHLCSRCQMALFDDDTNGGGNAINHTSATTANAAGGGSGQPVPLARRRDGKRVQCLAYRILLPNLQGRRPTKDVSWTLGCMRAILYAKQLDDAICFHMGVPVRYRMAEFVYAWFAPPDIYMGDVPNDQRDVIYAQADEARWSLYYGAKLLSRECVEAKVFLSFLDEKYGDDEATADERDVFDSKMKAMATLSLPPSERPSHVVSFDGKNDGPMLDAFQWLSLMLQEYREEQAQRRAAIRLMFQTATTNNGAGTAASPVVQSGSTDDLMATSGANAEMDMEQFRAMVLALNCDVTAGTIATFYRASYERGDGHVTYDAFMATAEALHFFTSCMRLPSPNVMANQEIDPTDKNGGINAPHARLGSLVAKHFTLYEAECKLNLQASPPLAQSLAKHALEEVHEVSRHHFMTACDRGDYVLRSISCDGVADACRLRRAELLLDSIRRKLSIHRLQRAFRARLLRDQGVPLNMRQLMHGGYGNGKTNYRDRRAIRPTKWLVAVIADLIRSKIEADASPSTNASRLFVEHIYDHMTMHFGSRYVGAARSIPPHSIGGTNGTVRRWEAEKTIHDIFVNTRSLVSTHPRILLFSQLCGMGMSGEDKIFGSPQAFAFITMVLHCGHHQFPILHTGHDNKERMVTRLRELERQSPKPKASDADMLLLFLLEEWRHYMLDRMNQIKVVCCSDSDLMAIEGYLSLDNVMAIFRRTGINISELEVAQVFRQVVQSNYSSLSLMERLVKFVFPILCHVEDLRAIGMKNDLDAAMATVDADRRRNSLSRAATVNSKLRAANVTVADADKFQVKYRALCDQMRVKVLELRSEHPLMRWVFRDLDTDADGSAAQAAMWTEQVDQTAKLFRKFLTECTRLRALAKIEIGPIPDQWHPATNAVAAPPSAPPPTTVPIFNDTMANLLRGVREAAADAFYRIRGEVLAKEKGAPYVEEIVHSDEDDDVQVVERPAAGETKQASTRTVACTHTMLCERYVGATKLFFHHVRGELEIQFLAKNPVATISKYCKANDDIKRLYLPFNEIKAIGYEWFACLLAIHFAQLPNTLLPFDVSEKYLRIANRRFKKATKCTLRKLAGLSALFDGPAITGTTFASSRAKLHESTAVPTQTDNASLAPTNDDRTAVVVDSPPRKQRYTDEEKAARQEAKDRVVVHYPMKQAKNRITLTEGDLGRLEEGEFLNDNLIDFFFKYGTPSPVNTTPWAVVVTDFAKPCNGVYCYQQLDAWQQDLMYFFSTHFYTTLVQQQKQESQHQEADKVLTTSMAAVNPFDKIRRWTKHISIFTQRFLFVPINDNDAPCILFFDSLQCHNKVKIIASLQTYLENEFYSRYSDHGITFDVTLATLVEPEVRRSSNRLVSTFSAQVPRQTNSCDCGVFVLLYALELIKRYPGGVRKDDVDVQCRNLLHEVMFCHQNIVEFRDYLQTLLGVLSVWQSAEYVSFTLHLFILDGA
ncbi:hypothetical protein DYB32_005635 [Aphanomyces invadans]|uniref:Ubiquitin-like protease family profile domain-containing protein n=1 Tax=Aphanomyces invadans TaxID=157072 RepID=A0A418AU25_9STRA|nr:hypothetical protein DYB32_005635 [Aphanomyces invadans]